jgi:DNA-binding response OmpR family regulator
MPAQVKLTVEVKKVDTHIKILVVDDDESIRNATKRILEKEGYDVDLAATGMEAIEKTKSIAYNLALLDIRLPDMEGVELLSLIKDTVPKTRKIMITGYPSKENVIKSLNKHADIYLIKPVKIEKLLETVKEQLQLQEKERKICEQRLIEFVDYRVEKLFIS